MQILFNRNPQVQINRETIASVRDQMNVHTETFDDDETVTLNLTDKTPEMCSVFYSAQSLSGNEKGSILINEGVSGYFVDVERYSEGSNYLEQLQYSAALSGGYLKLTITGSGSGDSTEFKWRASPFNSLDFTPDVT